MGNYISCTFIFVPPLMTKNIAKAARVIFPTGEVKLFKEPVSVAELMLECPNHFLANSRSLQIAHRFSPLAADDDLELGNVYVFFHMRRANTVVTAADMAVIFVAESLRVKRLTGGGAARAWVHCGGENQSQQELVVVEKTVPRLSLDGVDLGFQYRMKCCRSRKPMLETIREEPFCSR
ncbi:uncharacterized protein LOC129321558 [Prosopis cineraria]|uniref:uncharacterized protein LOC129321558 n=1 Tax=Prosopis cineraria TaxID=364024 RepID=UPI002410366A|nr:uncharacterized protein LOC129321558 [Prosopis cineraria]